MRHATKLPTCIPPAMPALVNCHFCTFRSIFIFFPRACGLSQFTTGMRRRNTRNFGYGIIDTISSWDKLVSPCCCLHDGSPFTFIAPLIQKWLLGCVLKLMNSDNFAIPQQCPDTLESLKCTYANIIIPDSSPESSEKIQSGGGHDRHRTPRLVPVRRLRGGVAGDACRRRPGPAGRHKYRLVRPQLRSALPR